MFSHLLPDHPGAEPLARALKACRAHMSAALVLSALVNLLYLVPTLYMMQVYDRVVPTGGLVTLGLITAVTLFALATLAMLDWLRSRLLIRAGLRLDRLLGREVLSRTIESRPNPVPTQTMREFDTIRSVISGPAVLALFDVPWTPLYLACCFLLHPAIGALTLAGGVVLLGLAVLNERDSRPRLRLAIQATGAAYAAQEAITSQAELVRALGMRRALVHRQGRQRQAAISGMASAQMSGGKFSGAIKFLRLAMQSLSLGLAAYLAVKGQISPGAIIAASLLLSRAVAPVELVVGAWPTLIQARSSWTSLVEMFNATSGADRARTALPRPQGRVQMEQVSVRLRPSEPPQLRQVMLSLQPGETLGVVGPSGAGKTTLARVLAGALPASTGVVRLDGADYDARSPENLARFIGYLPQQPTLFAGTIKENISRFALDLGQDPGEIDAEVVSAAVAAGAHDMIQRLAHGYDTLLGPSGAGVSAGQAQRIALARALFGEPPLLVLDEPNSNLDQEGEAALMTAILGAAARGGAVVVVAHRAGVLSRVDRLLSLKDGIVQFEGPREEVLAKVRASASVQARHDDVH